MPASPARLPAPFSAAILLIFALLFSPAFADEGDGLYFFCSPTCGPCREVEPVLQRLAVEGYSITKIDVNQYPRWADHYRVDRLPTLIMVRDYKEQNRHLGAASEATIRSWFAQQEREIQRPPVRPVSAIGNENPVPVNAVNRVAAGGEPAPSSTMHQGTAVPRNQVEEIAMDATVRLRVEDPEGFSYATGTVIHCLNGEWLVLTCGHVFRNSGGQGKITGEFGFGDGRVQRIPGELVGYESEVRDVGLVALKAGFDIEPVPLASDENLCSRGSSIFSIGCDQGDDPTIRHSKIKDKIKCDGVPKYLIYGRPVIGRSGGGLFDEQGRLVGVCNAASVDIDEGIYASLEDIEWQLNRSNLAEVVHQSSRGATVAARTTPPTGLATFESRATLTSNPSGYPVSAPSLSDASDRGGESNLVPFDGVPPAQPTHEAGSQVPDTHIAAPAVSNEEDLEVLVTIRSRSNPENFHTIRLQDASPELKQCLHDLRQSEQSVRPLAPAVPAGDYAQWRNTMPPVNRPVSRPAEFRAQSPR